MADEAIAMAEHAACRKQTKHSLESLGIRASRSGQGRGALRSIAQGVRNPEISHRM